MSEWISAYNINNRRKMINSKRFLSFDKGHSKKSEIFSMILEVDKKKMKHQYLLKQFHWNLVNIYEKSLLQKYFMIIIQFGLKRKNNHKKGEYLENLINSRSAICILKLWQVKSSDKIEKYKKICNATKILNLNFKKLFFSGFKCNIKEIIETRKKETLSLKFFSKKRKTRVLAILLNMMKLKAKKNKSFQFYALNKKIRFLTIWKKRFIAKKQKIIRSIIFQKNFEFLIKKRL